MWSGLRDTRLAVRVRQFDTWLRFAGVALFWPLDWARWGCRRRFGGTSSSWSGADGGAATLHDVLTGIDGVATQFLVGAGFPALVTPEPMFRAVADDGFAELEASLTDRLDVGLIVPAGAVRKFLAIDPDSPIRQRVGHARDDGGTGEQFQLPDGRAGQHRQPKEVAPSAAGMHADMLVNQQGRRAGVLERL